MKPSNETGVAGLRPGDHGCCLYGDEADLKAVVAGFVREGIEDGARILWLWDRHAPAEIESLLRAEGVEIGPKLAEDRIQLRSMDETLLRSRRFRLGDALDYVRDRADRARDDGYSHLRIILETGALAARLDDPAPLLRFEAEVETLVQGLPCAVLCLYSLEEIPSSIVLEALDTHPLVTFEGRTVPSPGGGGDRPASLEADTDLDLLLQDRLALLAPQPDVPESRAAQRTSLGLLSAMEVAGRATDENAMLRAAVRDICLHAGWPVGHVWVLDEAGDYLFSRSIWYMEKAERFRKLRDATEAVRFRRGVGLPGHAWAQGRSLGSGEVGPDRGFFQNRGQEALGVREAFAIPIRVGSRVLAVIELSSPDRREVDEDLRALLEHVGTRLGELLELRRMGQRLTVFEQRFKALEEASPGVVIVTDQKGEIHSWSPGAVGLFSRESREVVGTSVSAYIPDWQRTVDEVVLDWYLATGEPQIQGRTVELEGIRKDGSTFPIELALTSWESGGTRFFGNVVRPAVAGSAVGQDPSQDVEAGRWLHDAVIVTTGRENGEDAIVYASSAFGAMTGYDESEVVGQSVFELIVGPETEPEALERIRKGLDEGEAVAEQITAYRKDGQSFMMGWSVAPVRNDEGGIRHFVHIQTDVTRERQAWNALRRAEADALTGLADRSVLIQKLQRCIDRHHSRSDYRFAVLFLDLNDFKAVNDRLGHVVGDRVLVNVARRLERSVRPGDTIARYGGDEFVILLDFVLGIEDVIAVAERIRSEIALPFDLDGREVALSASIGIALSETGYESPVRMLEDADAAMYRVKQSGTDGYRIYDEALHQEALSVLRMESELLRSVKESAFMLQYQPLVALSSGRIIGFEALLRWRHPDRGALSPTHFLALAESTGLIISIGEWVLREACRSIQEWQETFRPDPPLVLSVNVSGKELSDPEFIPRLQDILEETGLEPERLQLELTEFVLAEEHERLEGTLKDLRRMGVMTCIDDFGTGYASLVQVQRSSLGTLKIDRVLVERLETEQGNGTPGTGGGKDITRAILSLARDLGINSIAEGVETQSQLDWLVESGCEVGQGFFFSAPVDAEGVQGLLQGQGGLPRIGSGQKKSAHP